jgi:SAM-dependent methyltransferase
MIYPDLFNPDLLDRIPLDARVVLDVGCGTGALGAEYKRRNPAARVLGIERDPAAAEIAEQRLDAVARADLDRTPLPFGETLPPGSVDCLLYGDVLEHLADPWALLRAHVRLLSERGVIVICMPNAEHWSFAERLLRGTFAYEPLGLFDQSHLRWFTTETMRRTLRGVGLAPLDVIPRIFDKHAAEAFCDAAEPGLRRLGIDVAHYRERCAPLQHVWRARRRPTRPLPLVSTMLNPVGGVSHLRVVEPMAALAAEPTLATRVIDSAEAFTADADNPGIFIFHRPLLAGGSGLTRVREIAERGWLVLCEFDDHPDYIPVLQRPDVQNFRAVHAVQTSTEPLAEVLRRDNPEIKVFPNGIARLPDVTNFRDPSRLTMLFAGINREKEWQPYLDALNNVVRKAGERLQVVVVNDRPLFEFLATPHKRFVPLCGYDTYQALLGASEISFAPLIDTPFNRCKSDLKFIEAAAHRVTALASRVVYEGSIRDGETGVLFSTGEELEQRLLRLVANPEIARTIGDAARAYVMRERMLAYQIADRVAWYHALWARRAELHAALLRRVPEFVG